MFKHAATVIVTSAAAVVTIKSDATNTAITVAEGVIVSSIKRSLEAKRNLVGQLAEMKKEFTGCYYLCNSVAHRQADQ